jgi:threonine dehydrogenase-like Zn-dependent dehydrogenase
MPFAFSDGTCVFCRAGLHTSCIHGGFFGNTEVGGAQAEALRIPLADGTLFVVPAGKDDAVMASLLTLSDVMGTGHHAAVVARVGPGKTAAVVGDGTVGLCGVIAARRLGADQIIILGRHPDRIALAREFGATDVVSERGEEAVARVRELTGGFGVHSVLECVGTDQSMHTAISIARPVARWAASAFRKNRRSLDRSRRSSTMLRWAAAPRPSARISRNSCPTSSRVGSIPAGSSIGRQASTRCLMAIGL